MSVRFQSLGSHYSGPSFLTCGWRSTRRFTAIQRPWRHPASGSSSMASCLKARLAGWLVGWSGKHPLTRLKPRLLTMFPPSGCARSTATGFGGDIDVVVACPLGHSPSAPLLGPSMLSSNWGKRRAGCNKSWVSSLPATFYVYTAWWLLAASYVS